MDSTCFIAPGQNTPFAQDFSDRLLEGAGVRPAAEIEARPEQLAQGLDDQMEYAIKVVRR